MARVRAGGLHLEPAAVAGALAFVTLGSLLLRTGGLHAGYWIDEAIAVGVASHDLVDIPGVLRQDGSPPLYYLLLHEWMSVVGSGEAATRMLSLLFATLAVPVSWWAGHALFDRRTAALVAMGAAACPFLTYYAQESRMYALVALLSLLAGASFVLAFLHGRRRHVVLLGVWLIALLYTHTWGVFLAAGMAAAWLSLWREGRVRAREGLLLAVGLAVAYAPWIPNLLFQTAHTGAPWAERPSPLALLGVPGGVFGYVAIPLLALAVYGARGRMRDDAVRVLVIITVVTACGAWLSSQLEPAWSTRYLAVLFGPLLLALAGTVARGNRFTAAALAGVLAVWVIGGSGPAKSNVRTVAADVTPEVRAGDLVVSTQPEQVPVLHRYLPAGLVYVTPLGVAADPRITDWRDGLARMRHGRAQTTLEPLVAHMVRGQHVLLVTPVPTRRGMHAPWQRAVRTRTREWRHSLRSDRRLQRVGSVPGAALGSGRSAVRATVFTVR
jgi:mannosyltransferase